MPKNFVRFTERLDRDIQLELPGNCLYEVWRNTNGQLHREDAPAFVARSLEDGRVQFEAWYQNGQLHKDDGPACVSTESPGSCQLSWYQYGKLHRDAAPAEIIRDGTGAEAINLSEHWANKGLSHRVGGPSYTSVSCLTGVVCTEMWMLNGKLHRMDGPSEIHRDEETGIVIEESWTLHGKFHRIDGPAFIRRNPVDGTVIQQKYYRDDQLMEAPIAPPPAPR